MDEVAVMQAQGAKQEEVREASLLWAGGVGRTGNAHCSAQKRQRGAHPHHTEQRPPSIKE